MDWDYGLLAESFLLPVHSKIVLALSGGPDSIYLFHTLQKLKRTNSFEFVTAHYNHQLRETAAEEAEFVATLSNFYGVQHFQESGDVASYAKKMRVGIEEAARMLRYKFLNQVANQVEAPYIFLAHHMDDQVETILMHMMRGSGLNGLEGIRAENGRYIRPLLSLKKETILKLLIREGYVYCEDESNQDVCYMRNRIRHQLIPLWNEISRQEYPYGLIRLGYLAEEANFFLEKEVDKIYECVEEHKTFASVSVDQIMEYDIALRKILYRRMVEYVQKTLKNLTFQDIQQIEEICYKGKHGSTLQLSATTFAGVLYGNFYIYQLINMEHEQQSLKMGNNQIDLGIGYLNIFVTEEMQMELEENVQYIDAEKVSGALYCRTRKSGDRFHPFGMSGYKKIKDYFNERKIPFFLREHWPLICDEQQIVAIPGHRISDQYRIDGKTSKLIRLQYKLVY